MRKLISFFENNRFLFFILLVAIGLRFYNISGNPPSLNWDEVSHGYNAYSILKTSKDEWGKFLPTIFRAYGDYKLPVYIYLTAISEVIFGLSIFAVRLPSLLSGILAVVFTYLLAGKLFGKKVATISALLVALEPWSLFLSRGAFEANLSLVLTIAGIYFFLVGLEKYRQLVVSAMLLGLAVWTYNSSRIFVPLLVVSVLTIYRNRIGEIYRRRPSIAYLSLLIILFFFIPMFYQLARPFGQARYGKVAIIDEGAIAKINESRQNSKLPAPAAKIVFNKGTYFATSFIKNWLSHFSPQFLFSEGETQYQFSVPHKGLLFWADLPFLLIGLIYLIRKRTKTSWVVLSWLIIAPIPSSLTREAPHVLRAITILPLPMMLTGLGLGVLLEKISRNLRFTTMILYSIIVFTSVKGYLKVYFLDYPKVYSWSWQYGYQQAVEYAKVNYSRYDKIIVTKKYGEPHEFFLFYWPWDPAKYQNDPNAIKFFQSDWYWVDRFDKFYFINDWNIPKAGQSFILESKTKVDCLSSRCLLITSPDNHPPAWKKIDTIDFLNGEGAFEIYEN